MNGLRRERFDTVVLFPNSLRTAWLAWLSGARRRVGFARDGRGWLLTDALPPKPKTIPHPVIDEYLRLAAHLGCDVASRQMELATLAEDERRLDDFWSRHAPPQCGWGRSAAEPPAQAASGARPRLEASRSSSVVCLNPGGAYGSAKHWPTDSFAELAARIATGPRESYRAGACGPGPARHGPALTSAPETPSLRGTGADEAALETRTVLVLCGPAERDVAREIVRRADHPRVVSLAEEQLSIGLTKAAVRRAELLVTTDSGPRHFAPPFGVPVVTLFGPTHVAWSETYYPQAVHLQLDVDCGPCQRRVCPLGHHRCMRDLTVDRVYAAVARVLEKKAVAAA